MEKVKLTGLWKHTDKNGSVFLNGSLNNLVNLTIMPNTFKTSSDKNSPDYIAYISPKEPKKEQPKRQQQSEL